MAKLNQIEVNGTTYDLQDKSIFTGTQSEVNSAISNGTIKEGDIVNITDDAGENPVGGGSSNIIYLTQEAYDALPASKETNGVEYRITDANTSTVVARNITYDNSKSGIEATSVQSAIDTVNSSLESFQSGIDTIVGAINTKAGTSLTRYDSPSDIANAILNISGKGWFTSGRVSFNATSKTFTVSCTDYEKYKNITKENFKVGLTLESTKYNWQQRSWTISITDYNASTGVATISIVFSNDTAMQTTVDYILCIIP